jgi:hypothetical protein
MPNIQTLTALSYQGTYLGGVATAIDLDGAVVNGTYVVDNGSSVVEYSYPAKNSKFVSKIETPLGLSIVTEKPVDVSNLAKASCAACEPYVPPTAPIEIVSSCANPVYVEICKPGDDQELIFTEAGPICVDNAGVKEGWYVREKIIWNSVTGAVVSRETEYSKDGVSWSSTAPSGTITLGSCSAAPSTDCELIVTEPIEICARYVGTSGAAACQLDGVAYENWLVRERIIWDSVTCLENSKTVEYSKDGVLWVATAPADYILGECPDVTEVATSCEISEAFGNDLSTLKAGKSFSITKPACCKIKVTTDIGSFHVLDGIQQYSSSDFTCEVNVTGVEIVSGNCTLDKIHIISNNF